jgi:diadenylate cyclase
MLLTALSAVGLADLLDIALVTALIYLLLVWFKQAKAAVVAKGMLVVTAVYMLARGTGMIMTTSIFHGFFAILLVALVVIFQEELRSTFERIAVWSLSGGKASAAGQEETDELVRAISDLARERVGALIVLRGQDPLDRHLEGGWPLDGRFSEALLKSVFDDHSIGHDGAVILEEGRITHFGCRLPLSKEFSKTAKLGTRHTAALGLAELTDAMCIVVSEERGSISIAQDGKLERLAKLGDLQKRIRGNSPEPTSLAPRETLRAFMRKNSREKAIAFSASVLLWGLFVLGAKGWRQSFEVPVQAANLPARLEVVGVKPDRVQATFSGLMRDFYWVDRSKIVVRVDVSHATTGANRVRLSNSDVSRPAGFFLEDIEPKRVKVILQKKTDSKKVSLWR